jgi:hypothetical protein
MKKIKIIALFFIAFLFFLPFCGKADVVYDWAINMGGVGGQTNGNAIAQDGDGNVYITGHFYGTVDFDPGAGVVEFTSLLGDADIFVSKFDSTSAHVWTKVIAGDTGTDWSYSITIDNNGNVYTTGYFSGTVDFDPGVGVANLTSIGDGEIFISKLNSSGDYVWAKSMSGLGDDTGYFIKTDSSGNVYTTGYFSGTVDFDPGAGVADLTSSGSSDIFISKLNSSGEYVWAKSIGGISEESGNALSIDSSGNVYTTGYFSGTVDFDPGAGVADLTSSGSTDIFINKLNSSGESVLAKNIGGTSSDSGNSLAVDSSGNIYTTGSFYGTVDFDPGAGVANLSSSAGSGTFISKLNLSGEYVWAKSIIATVSSGNTIVLDNSNNVYTIGNFTGTADFDPGVGVANLTAVGDTDVFISKLSSAGIYVLAKNFGGSNLCSSNSSTVSNNGTNIYTTGFFNQTVDFDPGVEVFELTALGVQDIFINKLINGIPANVVPVASSVSIAGDLHYGEVLTGSYVYSDVDSDLEGASTYRWLRDDVAIDGATSLTYTTVEADVGATIKFEAAPVALTGESPGTAVASTGVVILANAPSLTTEAATSITNDSAVLHGTITSTGGANAMERGFVYGLISSLGATVSESGSFSEGAFSLTTEWVDCGTTTYFRSYAINISGTVYGDMLNFTTDACQNSSGSSIIGHSGFGPFIFIGQTIQSMENNLPVVVSPSPDENIFTDPGDSVINNTEEVSNSRNSTTGSTKNIILIPAESTTEETKPEDVKIVSPDINNFLNKKKSTGSSLLISKMAKEISDNLETPTGKIISGVVTTTGVVAGASVATGVGVIPFSTGATLIFKNIMDFFGFFMFAFAKRVKDKKRFWGTVYDSVTKQPLDPVYVVLSDLNGKEIATSITDLDGRYGFLVPPGNYQIKVRKTNYRFPSSKLQNQTEDILYSNLYFGGMINVEEGGVIAKNIPMDSMKFDWNEFAKKEQGIMKFFSRKEIWINRLAIVLFIIGFILSIFSISVSPSVFNFVILAVYLVLLIFRLTIFNMKIFGDVTSGETRLPLAFAIIRIFQSETNQEIAHKVTDIRGRYYCLVPNGTYYVKIEKKNLDGSYSFIHTSPNIEVKKGYINKKFEI